MCHDAHSLPNGKATLSILFGRRALTRVFLPSSEGKKIKNKISYLACIGGKNKKDALKLVFYDENKQIPYDLSTFLMKI